jgi:hypothetical protein
LTTTASVASSYSAGQSAVFIPVGVTRTGGSMPLTGPYVLDRLFWSTNPTWDGSDPQLWESDGSTPDFPVTTLNSSGFKSVVATISIPNVSPGTYYIISVVDPTNFWTETNEGNNVTSYPVTVTHTEADGAFDLLDAHPRLAQSGLTEDRVSACRKTSTSTGSCRQGRMDGVTPFVMKGVEIEMHTGELGIRHAPALGVDAIVQATAHREAGRHSTSTPGAES